MTTTTPPAHLTAVATDPLRRTSLAAGILYMLTFVASTSRSQAAWLEDFGAKPLVVLTAAVGSDATWVERRAQLATLSEQSQHRLIDGADHAALIHDEVHAAATSDAILDVVAAVRDDQPLGR